MSKRRTIRANVLAVCAALFAAAHESGRVACQTASPESARARESARFDAVRAALRESGVAFEERPLFAEYGAFGTSVRTGGADGGGLILAVPLLSADERDAAAIPALSFAQESILALLRAGNAGGLPGAFTVFFLGDTWTGRAADPSASYAAWQDVLDDAYGGLAVCLDMSAAPAGVRAYSGGGAARAPLAALKGCAAVLRRRGIPFRAGARHAEAAALFSGAGSLFRAAETPLLYLSGEAAALFPGARGSPRLSADDIAAFLREAAPALARSAAEGDPWENDINYRAVSAFGRTVFAPERAVLGAAGMFAAVTLWLTLRAWRTRRRRRFLALALAAPLISALALVPAGTVSAMLYLRAQNGLRETPRANNAPLVDGVTCESRREPFLERDNIALRVRAAKEPLRFTLVFESSDPGLYVYDAPLPFRLEPGGIRFVSGNYPPGLLDLEFALPAGVTGGFRVEALFTDGSRARAFSALP